MGEKITAVVPAYNEENWIKNVLTTLKEAKEAGIIDDIIVVDDGSTDRTGEIAKELGIRVIRHDTNKGKSEGFMTAARDARESDIIFMTDADMTNLTPEKIEKFLNGIKGRDDVWMIRSGYKQNEISPKGKLEAECLPQHSGFRAIRTSALQPLYNGWDALEKGETPSNAYRKWMRYLSAGGFGLEKALEELIPENRKAEAEGLNLSSRERGRGGHPLSTIKYDFEKVDRAAEQRSRTAESLNILRKLRSSRPDDQLVTGRGREELVRVAEMLPRAEIEKIRQELEAADREGTKGKFREKH
ncbi:MAG: glycosyltransferase [Candidatus Altiarchaeota archaeon]